jgi:hypothetical protein
MVGQHSSRLGERFALAVEATIEAIAEHLPMRIGLSL